MPNLVENREGDLRIKYSRRVERYYTPILRSVHVLCKERIGYEIHNSYIMNPVMYEANWTSTVQNI
jgi:hypothetical protein